MPLAAPYVGRRGWAPAALAFLVIGVSMPCALAVPVTSAEAKVHVLRPVRTGERVIVFRLRGIEPRKVVAARLYRGRRVIRRLGVARVRAAARRGYLRLRVSRPRRRPVRRAALARLRRSRHRLEIVTDTRSPDTTITDGPTGTVSTGDATFSFSSSEPRSTFECQLDARAWAECSSPHRYSGVPDGYHVFRVRSSDRASNMDATPAARDFTVSAAPLAVTPPVVRAAGDIACDPGSSGFNGGLGTADGCRQRATSDLLAGADAVLALGDNQYEDGTLAKFQQSYAPSWGRFLSRTYPIPGNHEYLDPAAAGYFAYFGSRAGDPSGGYYSFDLGSWHLVALNSTCSQAGGCDTGSAQEQWLRQDLAANPRGCTLAFWHHPRFASGKYSDDSDYIPFWQALYEHGAELILNGHDHNYQRYAPQSPAGTLDATRGIREFVVGTGGKGHSDLQPAGTNREVSDSTSFGVLELVLEESGYRWRFLPAVGDFADTGAGTCH